MFYFFENIIFCLIYLFTLKSWLVIFVFKVLALKILIKVLSLVIFLYNLQQVCLKYIKHTLKTFNFFKITKLLVVTSWLLRKALFKVNKLNVFTKCVLYILNILQRQIMLFPNKVFPAIINSIKAIQIKPTHNIIVIILHSKYVMCQNFFFLFCLMLLV